MDIGGSMLPTKKALHYISVAVTPACPEFQVGCRLGRELFTFPYAAADAHGAMGCDQKTFTLEWW